MPDIIIGLNDDDVIGDAHGPGDLWTDVKTLGKKRTYVRVGDTKGHAVRTRQGEVHTEYVNVRAAKADRTFYRDNPLQPFKHMVEGLPRVRGLVVGMFSEFSKDLNQLLKFAATKTAETCRLRRRCRAARGLSNADGRSRRFEPTRGPGSTPHTTCGTATRSRGLPCRVPPPLLRPPVGLTAAGPPHTDFTVGRRWPTAPVPSPHRR